MIYASAAATILLLVLLCRVESHPWPDQPKATTSPSVDFVSLSRTFSISKGSVSRQEIGPITAFLRLRPQRARLSSDS